MAPSPLTAQQRSLRARAAAYALHAQGGTSTAAATAANMARFERQVDPDGILAPDVRAKRAEQARRSYMSSLALKSSRARNTMKAAPVMQTSGAATMEGHGNDRPSI
jgi:hypothetical protein